MPRGRFGRNKDATSPIEATSRNRGVCFRARAGPGPRPGWFAPARMGPTHTHTHKRHGGGRPGSRFPAESAAADSAGVGTARPGIIWLGSGGRHRPALDK